MGKVEGLGLCSHVNRHIFTHGNHMVCHPQVIRATACNDNGAYMMVFVELTYPVNQWGDRAMTDEERLSFFKDIITLVRPEKIRWKAADWDDPTQWVSRGRGLTG